MDISSLTDITEALLNRALSPNLRSLISLAVAIAVIVARWLILSKAGEPGWISILPIFGDYWSHKVAGAVKQFWGQIISVIVLVLISAFALAAGADSYDGAVGKLAFIGLLVLVCSVFVLVMHIQYLIKLSRSFGHGGGFACGLFFLEPVFLMILGFSDNAYVGPLAGKNTPAAPAPAAETPPTVPNASVKAPGCRVILDGEGITGGIHLEIDTDMLVGRSNEADIPLFENTVSGRHCSITFRDGAAFLTDLNSTNGTYVGTNGRLAPFQPVQLYTGMVIRMADRCIFHVTVC